MVSSFDEHGSTMVLDMLTSMSFLPGLGLECCQHGFGEFIAVVDHDTPFGFGFVSTEVDYRYMARLRKEGVRARLTYTPFNYLVRPYNMSLADYFVKASELQMHLDGIIRGFSTIQDVELQRHIH